MTTTRAYPPLIISINRQVIDGNRKNGTNEPPLRIQRGRGGATFYGHAFRSSGVVQGYYEPAKPLKCGARFWLETTGRVRLQLNYPLDYIVDFLETMCTDGHVEKVKPIEYTVGDRAILGSDADFCKRRGCGLPILLDRAIYKAPKKEARHGR